MYVAIVILSLCSVMAMIRFIKCPTLPDRVTAFDLFAAIVISNPAKRYSVLMQNGLSGQLPEALSSTEVTGVIQAMRK